MQCKLKKLNIVHDIAWVQKKFIQDNLVEKLL